MNNLSNYICHHGIKGQRWGIRRYQNSDGSLTSLGKRRMEKLQSKKIELEKEEKMLIGDSVKKDELKERSRIKSTNEMTDDELRNKISRLGLEKQYRDYMRELYPSNSPRKKQNLIDGKKIVGEILTGSLTTVGKSVATNLIGAGVNKFGKTIGFEDDLYKQASKKQKSS